MKKKVSCIFLIILLCILSGCGVQSTANENKITVVASLFPQYDFCREITKNNVNVVLLLPPGMESHNYEPSVSDSITIAESDLFIYTGKYMEPWAETVISGLGAQTTVVDCSSGINLCEHVHDDEGHENHDEHHSHEEEKDPHIWTDPINCIQMVNNITEALCEIDAKNSDFYKQNASEYIEKLYGLDREFKEISENAPSKLLCHGGRFSMTYFSREYGFEFVSAFDSCSSSSEPSAKKVVSLINEVKKNNLNGVFYEELTEPKVARVIGEEANVPVYLLHTCHNLTKEEFERGETYLSLMEQNAKNLRAVLGE